jgi:hypothetical protein
VTKRWKGILSSIAIYHTYCQDNYSLDRLLANLRQGREKVLLSLLTNFCQKLDENFRFVNSQASSVAHWLSFQSSRICDKSRSKINDRYVYDDDLIEHEQMFESLENTNMTFFDTNPFAFASHKFGLPLHKEY